MKSRIHDHDIDPDFCGDPAEFYPEDDCSSCLDHALMEAAFTQKCTGLKSCEFSINDYKKKLSKQKGYEACHSDDAKSYIQFRCEVKGQTLKDQQHKALLVILLSIIIALIYFCSIYYFKNKAANNFKLWDAKTCTPSDFTVKLRITDRMHQQYLREKKKHPDLQYDSHIKCVVEEQVNKLNNVLDTFKGEKVEIACISFGYKNGELIKLLKIRGY